MKNLFLTVLMFTCIQFAVGQTPNLSIDASQVVDEIRIDGILNEPAWQQASVASDFIQREPFNGQPATMRTEVRFLFDNSGLYVGATMYDPHPDSIPAQMGLRDATGLNADNFIVVISPFNDGINAFCFLVYASDVQADFKLPGPFGNDDFSWDAVWKSKARITKEGWVTEIKIPYSAIRFPKKEVQTWGMNCQRSIRRIREVNTWKRVDNKISGYVNQCGLLEGIRDVTPPLRLSVTPYVSGYLQNSQENTKDYEFSYNYGADLKYGINESFTLDMTLIPDFGQVKSDDKVYNFSPFEIQYTERRQFFTEGTELFSKGGIFYSRRVGGEPKGYESAENELDSNEVTDENPLSTKLINATKISGRTSGGLGVGLFNAMSANTWAKVHDTVSGASRRILTQGFTNYNMIVLDQNLKNNSYIDFLNTNYYMPTEGYIANVTGTAFKFANKPYTYALYGEAFLSQKYYSHKANEFGYRYYWSFSKISGNFKFDLEQTMQSDKYDPNDMGFNPRNDFFSNSVNLIYNFYDPFWKLLNWYNNMNISYNTRFTGFDFTSLELWFNSVATTRKHLSLGINGGGSPITGYDYYEPRVDGWYYKSPAYGNMNAWISTDYRKKFAIDFGLSGYLSSSYQSSGFSVSISPRYRISDRLMLIYELEYDNIKNEVGYVDDSLGSDGNQLIWFGRRDRATISNILEANYMIASNMSIDLRARHYWVTAPYYSYYLLQKDGSLTPASYLDDPDVNYNLFNLDLGYVWNFAPGSQVSVVWKNMINTLSDAVTQDFFENLNNTFHEPSANSFSIRFLYYLDAQYLKKKSKPTNLKP